MTAVAAVSGTIGPNTDSVTAGTSINGVYGTGYGAPMQLGTVITSPNGGEYMMVQAASASAAMASARAPNAYAILATFRAKLMTSAQAAAGLGLGFAPLAVIAAHDYFWARIGGTGYSARVAAGASAAKYLRTTATAGRLGTASTASCISFQAVITAIASASTSAGAITTNTIRTVYASKLAPIAASSPI